MMDKPSVMSQRTISLHLEARASKEADSLSAPCTTLSGLTCVALRTRTRNDSSCRLFVKSDNHTQKQRHDNRDVITP